MKKYSRLFLSVLLAAGLSASCLAEDVQVKADHPQMYTVKKGDTLWDISGMFLAKPWLWPQIWNANPQIKNPHLIYPGDEIELIYIDGKPRLQVNGKGGSGKMSPSVRHQAGGDAIPAIPIDAIEPFLSRPYVASKNQIDKSPYIVAFTENHVVASAGDKAYVRVFEDDSQKTFDVVRPGNPYLDGETGEVLGYKAQFVGTARLEIPGDPATVMLNTTAIDANRGDLLLAVTSEEPRRDFIPKAPGTQVNGHIIDVVEGVSQIGAYDIIVIDRGSKDGLEAGSVLQINSIGKTVNDPVVDKRTGLVAQINPIIDEEWARQAKEQSGQNLSSRVKLPDERASLVMVFRTFERVSFALVMETTQQIRRFDLVKNPD